MSAPIYVVAASNDRGHYLKPGQTPNAIVFETNIDGATLEAAKGRAAQAEAQGYGACRVGRVVFEGEPGFEVAP